MAQRLRAIFASTSAGMLASFVPQMMHRTLPTAASGVSSVVALLIAHTLGGARCGRRGGRLGGRRAARGWHGDAPGGPRAACGGPNSVSGFCGMWPVVSRTDDAARQALAAKAVWVFASRASASVRDRPTTRLHWYGPFGPRRTDRCDRLLFGSHGDEELLN